MISETTTRVSKLARLSFAMLLFGVSCFISIFILWIVAILLVSMDGYIYAGLMSFFNLTIAFLSLILALTMGTVSIIRIKTSDGQLKGGAYALTALIVALIACVLIGCPYLGFLSGMIPRY